MDKERLSRVYAKAMMWGRIKHTTVFESEDGKTEILYSGPSVMESRKARTDDPGTYRYTMSLNGIPTTCLSAEGSSGLYVIAEPREVFTESSLAILKLRDAFAITQNPIVFGEDEKLEALELINQARENITEFLKKLEASIVEV